MNVGTPTADLTGRIATRTDPVAQVTETAAFIRAGEDELFCVVYRPLSTPRQGIVICPSILTEQLFFYRTEVLAARAFAARGFAVIRFHYRGTGHSGGSAEDVTLDSMIDDVLASTDFLADATKIRSVVACGARWGAMVAGLTACRRPSVPVAMWEPTIDGDRFLGDAVRAQQMVTALASRDSQVITKAQVLHEMHSTGCVDLLGYPFSTRLYESTVGRSLAEVANGPSRPILLIQVGPRKQLKPDFVEFADSCRRNGSPVETALIQCNEAWALDWPRQSTDALIRTTMDWLGRLSLAS